MAWKFQSAVAHELFSDSRKWRTSGGRPESFKALSRMSSSPTGCSAAQEPGRGGFQSAVAHELFSDSNQGFFDAIEEAKFQSAVAHELFSDRRNASPPRTRRSRFKALSRMSSSPTQSWLVADEATAGFKALSRMSSSPTAGSKRCVPPDRRVSKRCRA